MQFSLLGGRRLRLPSGWTSETSYTLIGGADVRVPKGARVTLKGGSLIGNRTLAVSPGDGPEILVLACSVIGGVTVRDV